MIVQCEACVKRYWIDDGKIVKDRMFVNCPNCENKIILSKPAPTQTTASGGLEVPVEASARASAADLASGSPSQASVRPSSADWNVDPDQTQETKGAGGFTIGKKLLLLFSAFILITGSVLSFVYMKYVPALMNDQIDLRTYSISRSFSAAIQQPLLIKNYLLVNKMAGTNAKLPGVAYVSVLNKKGIVIAGIFGDQERFTPEFMQAVKEKGFPKEISNQNQIPNGQKESSLDFSIGGQKIHDVAVLIGDTGGEAHVGLFTEDVEKAIRNSLIPLLVLLVAIALLGSLSFFLVARTISIPIRLLTQAAEKISLGDIDLPIGVKGGGEIGELAASLERMRFSIKAAMNRLRRN